MPPDLDFVPDAVRKIGIFTIYGRDEWCMSEAVIALGDEIIGYVGKTKYVDRAMNDAEQYVREALKTLYEPAINALKEHPDVDAISRFDDYDSDYR